MTEHHDDSNDAAPAWGTTRFVPGGDVGLVARHTVALIARDNPSTRSRLWDLVARDAPLDDVLDELSSTGLKALPDFGIAQTEGDDIRIVVRGRVAVSVDAGSGDDRRIEGSDVRTWIEVVVRGVVSISMTLPTDDDGSAPDVADSDAFAVLAGSVPAARLTRFFDAPDVHAEVASNGPGWSSTPVRTGDAPVGSGIDVDIDVSSVPVDDIGTEEADTVDPESAPPAPGALFDDEMVTSQAPIVSGDSDSLDESAGIDESGSGVVGEVLDGESSAPPAPLPESSEHPVLVFSSGERVSVDRAVLIGRNPKIDEDVDGAAPRLMKFEGRGQGLSRTHAEVRVDDGRLVLEDLESTNGTEVEVPGQPRRRLRSGEPVVIVPGTLIDFGDELHCTVESPPRPADV